jgi:IS1 family transposase
MRSIQVLGKRVTGWQVLPVDAPDFESAALRACELVLAGDARIGKIPGTVDAHFATSIHFAQLIKVFSSPDITGPDWFGAMSRVTGTIPSVRCGRPEPRFVSTSHVERLNLSVRMHLRRYARRTNAHSRKLENHKAAFSLWVAWYNFVRVNTAVRNALHGRWNYKHHLDDAGFAGVIRPTQCPVSNTQSFP